MARISFTCWRLIAAILLAFSGMTVQAADAPITAGDGSHLWIIRPAPTGETFTILHRRTDDQPESRLTTAVSIRGRLITEGVAAGGGQLWLFYQDSSVQSIRMLQDALGRRGYTDIILPSLPKGITIRSIALTRSGGWVLARIEDQRLLDAIDRPATPTKTLKQKRHEAMERKLDERQPAPVEPPAPTNGPETAAPAKAEVVAGKPAAVKADRLLHLARDRWESVALPADWEVEDSAALVTLSYEDERPVLVTARSKVGGEAAAGRLVRWHVWEQPNAEKADAAEAVRQWVKYEQTAGDGGPLLFGAIDGQLVAMERTKTPEQIEWKVMTLRAQRVAEVGVLGLSDRGGGGSLTPVGDQLGLITSNDKDELELRRINLRGVTDANPLPLAAAPPSLGPAADYLLFVVILAVVTPVVILMMKRDPASQPVELPRGMQISDLLPRALAAMIDLFPCLYIASLITGVSVEQLTDQWPVKSGGWEQMAPGFIAIGLFTVITGISELFTGRTIGKAMVGLRVTGLKGQPPDLWQVLGRNLFKALDLIAVLPLVFAIISPHRQRLGDVVGRTVVVTQSASDDDAGKPKRPRDDQDDKDGSKPPPDPRPKRPR